MYQLTQLQILRKQAMLVEGDKVKVFLPPGVYVLFSSLLVFYPVDDTLHIAAHGTEKRIKDKDVVCTVSVYKTTYPEFYN